MSDFLKFSSKYAKIACLSTISVGATWLGYQVKLTQDKLNNALDTSIMSHEEILRKSEEQFLVINVPKTTDTELPFEGTWSSLKFTFAKHLLVLTKNENPYIRKKAVRQLAKIQTLEPWHCTMLGQLMDARTAVGLARTSTTDPRLLSKPVGHTVSSQDVLVDVMKDLLIGIHNLSHHPCVEFFITKAFTEFHDMDRFSDDCASLEFKKYIESSKDVLPLCLESILHHVSIKNNAKHLTDLNGLPILMEIYNHFKDNVFVTATIAQIIAYLSIHRELLDDLYKFGWIGVLASWLNHEDVRISIPAAKALANLDYDDDLQYMQRLYLLHPTDRTTQEPLADVVFVHGLLGGVLFTWRQRKQSMNPLGVFGKKTETESLRPDCDKMSFRYQRVYSDPNVREYVDALEEHYASDSNDFEIIWEDIPTNTNDLGEGPFSCPGSNFQCPDVLNSSYTNCWPKHWLAEDCQNLRIIGVNYDTNLSMWTSMCPEDKQRNLEHRSNELLIQLLKAGLGKRPIIWVTHSMGGLMVKNLLHKAYKSCDRELRNLCLQTKGIIFYSTPHSGSSVASFNPASALVLWPSIEVQELQQNSPQLLRIHKDFLAMLDDIPIKVITFVETKPTVVSAMKFKFLVVEPKSGNPGCGEYYEIPLDHLGICKPASRNSFIYQKVLYMIRNILKDINK